MNKDVWYTLPQHVIEPDPKLIMSENYGVLDFETTNVDKGNPHRMENHVVSVALRCNATGKNMCVMADEFTARDSLGDLSRFDYLVAHNAGFELGWLWRCGYELKDLFVLCTQIAEYTIAGNRTWGMYASVDGCLERRNMPRKDHPVGKLIRKGVCPSTIPPKYLMEYNREDIVLEDMLWRHMRKEMKKLDLLKVFYTKCLYTPVLVDIERKGLHLDKDRVEDLYDTTFEEQRNLQLEWDELTGGINPKSSPQKQEYFYGTLGFRVPKNARTEKGAAKTDAATLLRLDPKTPEQTAAIRVVRQLTKCKDLMSKYLSKFKACVEDDEGILTFRINQTTAATHRLSSTGQKYATQGQNIPRALKKLFSAREPDWEMAEIDQDGLEFRTAGHLGRDAVARDDILSGTDPHEMTGKIVFAETWNFNEKSKSKHNNPLRQEAKAETFKPLYGGIKGSPRQMEYYQAFRKKYAGISATQEKWADEVVRTGSLVTETGLRFYWPNTIRYSNGSSSNFQAICNYPVQYLATGDGGITPIAVILQWHLMQAYDLESFICNTIHDSSISEVKREEKEIFKEIAEWSFTKGATEFLANMYGIDLFVPLSATVEFYKYWSEKA